MKATSLKTAAVIAGTISLLAGNAMAQATTGVVGYETVDYVSGFNFVGARLHETPVASGTLETASATEAIDADVDLAALLDGSTFILEIEDAGGIIQEVTTSNGGTGLSADLTGVTAPVSYTLRPAATLASVFGETNSAGLTSTLSAGASDQVWLSDGAGGFTKYYYRGGGAPQWRNATSNLAIDSTLVNIVYTDGIIISSQPAGGSFVVTGDLKAANTSVFLADGFNFLGSIYPVGATIDSTFGATNSAGLTSTLSAGASDQIWVSDGAGGFSKYYYRGGGTPQWRNATSNLAIDATLVSIPSGYVILNTGGIQDAVTTPPTYYAGL